MAHRRASFFPLQVTHSFGLLLYDRGFKNNMPIDAEESRAEVCAVENVKHTEVYSAERTIEKQE